MEILNVLYDECIAPNVPIKTFHKSADSSPTAIGAGIDLFLFTVVICGSHLHMLTKIYRTD